MERDAFTVPDDIRDAHSIPFGHLTGDLQLSLESGIYTESGQFLKTTLADLADYVDAGSGGSIRGTFNADGAFLLSVPSGALIIGGKIVPNTATGATVSLGTTLGASDVLPAFDVPGSGSGPTPLQGINFLQSIFPANQTIFAHAPSWAPMTITIWYLI